MRAESLGHQLLPPSCWLSDGNASASSQPRDQRNVPIVRGDPLFLLGKPRINTQLIDCELNDIYDSMTAVPAKPPMWLYFLNPLALSSAADPLPALPGPFLWDPSTLSSCQLLRGEMISA